MDFINIVFHWEIVFPRFLEKIETEAAACYADDADDDDDDDDDEFDGFDDAEEEEEDVDYRSPKEAKTNATVDPSQVYFGEVGSLTDMTEKLKVFPSWESLFVQQQQ